MMHPSWNRFEFVSALPDHVIQLVFANLGPDDLLAMACICRRFHMIASTNSAWSGSCSRPFLALLQSINKHNFHLNKSIKSLLRSVWRRSCFFRGFIWERLPVANTATMPAMFHTSIYVPHFNGLLQFGGSRLNGQSSRQSFGTFATNDLIVLDLEKLEWHRPKVTGPGPPRLHSTLVTRIRNRLYFLGGCITEPSEGCPRRDASLVYMLETDKNPMVWHELLTTGDIPVIPVSRAIHAAYTVGDKIVLVGAWSGDYHRWHDVRVLDTLTLQWTSIHTKYGYCDGQDTSFMIQDEICTIDVVDQRLFKLDISTGAWINNPIAGNTMLKTISASVPIANKAICFDTQLNQKPWVLDVASNSWIELNILSSDCPDLLHGYSAVSAHGCVIVSGYSRSNRPEPQLWLLRPISF